MPNKQPLTEYGFRLEFIAALRIFSEGLRSAPGQGRGHMTGIVADKILELAEAGETNADRLCTGALRRLLQ
jgi:hypothetical protein